MSVFRTSNSTSNDRDMSPSRDPYPLNRAGDDAAIPDGPTERIAKNKGANPNSKATRVRNRSVFLVALLALFALNVALLAGYVAWRALSVARAGAEAAAKATPAGIAPSAATTPAPGEASYAVTYAQEPLRVQVGCSAIMFLDLDEPRANADQQVSDLRYDSRCGKDNPRLTLGPGAAAGSQISNADTDAAGCDKAIRTSPLGQGASVEVKKGAVMCVLTASTPAEMVLVEVTDVGTTGTAGMRATSWKVAG
jgi:hypothetical protein